MGFSNRMSRDRGVVSVFDDICIEFGMFIRDIKWSV